MKPKQVIEFVLYSLGILGFLTGVSALETLADHDPTLFFIIGVVVSILLIAAWVLLVIRDNARERRRDEEPQFYVQGPGGRLVPLNSLPNPQDLYDQEEDKNDD